MWRGRANRQGHVEWAELEFGAYWKIANLRFRAELRERRARKERESAWHQSTTAVAVCPTRAVRTSYGGEVERSLNIFFSSFHLREAQSLKLGYCCASSAPFPLSTQLGDAQGLRPFLAFRHEEKLGVPLVGAGGEDGGAAEAEPVQVPAHRGADPRRVRDLHGGPPARAPRHRKLQDARPACGRVLQARGRGVQSLSPASELRGSGRGPAQGPVQPLAAAPGPLQDRRSAHLVPAHGKHAIQAPHLKAVRRGAADLHAGERAQLRGGGRGREGEPAGRAPAAHQLKAAR
eukprot:scaffold2161_cov244-Pinguiococcus_pyrenoidosus.AAC.7